MKTNKTFIFTSLIVTVLTGLFFSCNIPVGLGNKLDIDGPVVEIISPEPRAPVLENFTIEGTATDFSAIEELVVTAELDNVVFTKEWRYYRGRWQISENTGQSWSDYPAAEWIGTPQSGLWILPINMRVGGTVTDGEELGGTVTDGEYVFKVTATDTGGFSDDNSFKTRTLILDQSPPSVEVSNPYLYSRFAYDEEGHVFKEGYEDIQMFDEIPDNDLYRTNPASIGKFVTQEFDLQWQITDNQDIGKIELLLYPTRDENGNAIIIDNNPETALPPGYIYSYSEEVPATDVKPNGSVTVPRLTAAEGTYDKGGKLSNPISEKTTIRVVAICYDIAGNANEERTLGYFVYWPKADEPWITFSGSMQDVYLEGYGKYLNEPKDPDKIFMVYPGRSIKATAFHAHGVKKVTYKLEKVEEPTKDDLGDIQGFVSGFENRESTNQPRSGSTLSTNFPWEFTPPPYSGYYVLTAQAYGEKDQESAVHTTLFRVQDITFPDFFTPVRPSATEPLFQFIGRDNGDGTGAAPDNTIRISGVVSDATHVESLTMVWINPRSRNFAAMSQLAYFRDQDYSGWKDALRLGANNETAKELEKGSFPEASSTYPYDRNNPNRLWNLALKAAGQDTGTETNTNRMLFTYSLDINLNLLNIGTGEGQQPLSSQVFLLRAQNPDGKCTITTYAPQGDTLAPTLGIQNVVITSIKDTGPISESYTPNTYAVIPQFGNNDVITINGTWKEDSAAYLPIETYFSPNLLVTINGKELDEKKLPPKSIEVTRTDPNATEGTWTANVTVGAADGTIAVNDLRDTFVVSAEIRDIGGNKSEVGSAWLIQSDYLRLMRISSDEPDGSFNAGKTIRIFLEFSKAVQLTNPGTAPTLTLNTGGTAVFDPAYQARPTTSQGGGGGGTLNTRQYFTYTVGGNHTTTPNYLNVTGLSSPGTWSDDGYPFTWNRGKADSETTPYEEIRVTNVNEHHGALTGYGFYARRIPVDTADPTEYQFTLIASKHLEIDNTAPNATSIVGSPQGWHGAGVELFITATFDQAVRFDTDASGIPVPANIPYLILDTGASPPNNRTSTVREDVRVNGTQIIFRYRVKPGDTATANDLRVTGIGGKILDIPGNEMSATNNWFTLSTRRLSGVRLDTTAPARPTVTLHNGNPPTTVNRIGTSASGAVNLGTLYDGNLYIQVAGTPGEADYGRVEYSLNNGTDWTSATAATSTIDVLNNGPSQILARQTDRAGNVSPTSNVVEFNWDKGALITRISSTSPNGTYTHVSGRNQVNVTVYFRKPLTFTAGTPVITLNALRGGNPITVTGSTSATATDSLSFTYPVQNGDSLTGPLDVTNISGFTEVRDSPTNWTNVASYLNGILPIPAEAKLAGNKQIRVETGNLTNTPPAFAGGSVQDDGSYPTTLEIQFNHAISKGSGSITIEQNSTNYRLPAVLTEAQYNRFRGVSNFDTYYTKGTNGYINDQGADTSTKYVLNYQYNPDSAAATDKPASAFFDNFRTAEKITVDVNALAVQIANGTDGANTKLVVTLSGSNAPQVPGATYLVSYPNTLVTDTLGNICTLAANVSVSLGGVAKPFIRIRKSQDTISQTGDAGDPRLTVTLPMRASVRMDSRTPGTTIQYTANSGSTNITSNNWSSTGGPTDTNTTVTTRPTTNNGSTYSAPFEIGDDNYQGFQWWVLARARTGTNPNFVYSSEAEDVAFRTVITYQLRNGTNAITAADGEAIMQDGDQIWIRGGDAIGSSSIPGFPITWEDNWNNLSGKRAGIRLLLKDQGDALNNSRWRWVTWEINTTAYVDFIKGRDLTATEGGTSYTESTVEVAWQYGPRRWAYQRAGWTSYKTSYPIYPGKHRWCDAGQDHGSKGAINFSGTFSARPEKTVEGWPTGTVNQPY